MKLLFLANTCPLPATNGLTMRSSSVLSALSALGHRVFLLSFVEAEPPEEIHRDLARLCFGYKFLKSDFANVSSPGQYWSRLKNLWRSSPYGLLRYGSAAMRNQVLELLQQERFDAIVCDTIDSIIHLPADADVPVIVNNHNVEHLILERYLPHEHNPAKKLYGWLEAKKLRRWEAQACSRGRMVWVCSGFDREVLQQLCPGVHFEVVPNAIDTDSYVPSAAAVREPVVLYSGGMDWYPNRDAVKFFVHEVLPGLERQVPNVQFVVAGRAPSADFRRRVECRNVTFTGTVPDMRPEIARAAVCVVPLRIGSGTRLKILEAAALSKPVVSTSLGSEGLEFIPGKEIAIADEPSAFAARITELLGDPELSLQMGRAARAKVCAKYGFDSLRHAIASSLETTFATRSKKLQASVSECVGSR
jgi:glycosyltransferase involved in cell wall biosynthesis